MRELAERFTADFEGLFLHLSQKYDRILVAGTHPRFVDGKLQNVASIFVPGHGPVHQPKLHLTPTERHVWHFESGQEIHIIDTDFGRMGVSICYDVQFPEVARIQAEQGVQLLVVPYLTDDRRGYSRVTTCARARAVENQIYVVTAGMVGSLPLITDLTAQYAQSGVYTPSDFPFPMDGIATEAAPNSEMVLVGDIDLAILDQTRARGSVLNHQDAAQDGLHVSFRRADPCPPPALVEGGRGPSEIPGLTPQARSRPPGAPSIRPAPGWTFASSRVRDTREPRTSTLPRRRTGHRWNRLP